MTTLTAAQRRSILANAHAAWFRDGKRPEIDAVRNLKQALVQTNRIESHDFIEDVYLDGTAVCIRIVADGFYETLELDAYGNILRGVE